MRYIRPTAVNKENKENAFINQHDKERMQELKLQIKSAYTQINMLKETNKKLLWKIQIMEKEMQNHELIKQEVQFLKEQEHNYKQQLDNQDAINRKLREQLEKTERQKNELSDKLKELTYGEEAKTTSRMNSNKSEKISLCEQPSARIQEYKSLKTPYQTSARASVCMSLGNERSKQNHHSTPKSKIKINLDHLMAPENPNQRRKVFF